MVKIPDNVTSEEACFSILGSIALNSIRQLKSSLGENIVVYGLGLVGLIVCKLLKLTASTLLESKKMMPDAVLLSQMIFKFLDTRMKKN